MMAPLLTKRYRLTMDFEVTVEDLVDEGHEAMQDEWLRQAIARQRHLLHALLSNARILDGWIRARVGTMAAGLGDKELIQMVGGISDNEFEEFAPVLAQLPEDDQAFFQEARDRQLWYENTEEVNGSFTTEMTRVQLKELPAPPPSIVNAA